MTGISADTSGLTPLHKVFRNPSKLCETRLAVPDIVDHALQSVGVLFKDGVDDIAQIFRKGITTLVCRRTLGVVLAASGASMARAVSFVRRLGA